METNPLETADQSSPTFSPGYGNAASVYSRTDFSGLRDSFQRVRGELVKVIVGQTKMLDLLMTALLANGHVLIEGVPGVAKTLTTKLLAKSLELDFQRIQFTPDLMPSDVTGSSIFSPKTEAFEFRKGPVFANLVLIDEINRAPAKTQSALFEVMEERQVTVDGTTYSLAPPFLVFATQNPIEQEGTYRLPEAQLDRFLFKIDVPYPSLEEEHQILVGYTQMSGAIDWNRIQPVLDAPTLVEHQTKARQLHVEDAILKYVAHLVHQTRNHPELSMGASPRASLGILQAAKAFAALQGRDFVSPDDVKYVIYPVLRHRIQLTPEREMEGTRPDDVIERIIENTEVPR